GDGGEVQAREVDARGEAAGAVVVGDRDAGELGVAVEEDATEAPGGGEDLVVRAGGDRGEDGDAAASGGAAVGVDVDRDVGAGTVEDPGAAGDAGADAVVGAAGHHHLRALADKVGAQVGGDVEVEARLGVAGVRLGAGRVAGLFFAAVPD